MTKNLSPKIFKLLPFEQEVISPLYNFNDMAQVMGGFQVGTDELIFGNLKLQGTQERILLGSATAPLTGTGIFLGLDGSDYEFRAGNPSGDYIHWTGSALDVKGTLTASSIHIPDLNTTANSFHAESDGDTFWGCTQTNFTANNDNASAYILKTGVAKFQKVTISGGANVTFISDTLDTSAKNILKDFNFGSIDYAGAVKAGDIAWNTTTGAITSGSGVVVYRGGIVGATAGVATFSLDSATGNATFAGTLSAPSGTLGTITAGAIYSGLFSTATLASTGQRAILSNVDNTIRFYDASNNQIIGIGSDVSIYELIIGYNDVNNLDISNVASLVQTNSLVSFRVNNTSSTANSLTLGSVGTGGHILFTGDPTGVNSSDGEFWFSGVDLKIKIATDTRTLAMLEINETVSGTWAFSTAFPTTPSANPTTDYQVSNKKYVDDNVGFPDYAVGDNLVHQDSSVKTTASTILVKVAEFEVSHSGTLTIKFSLKSGGAAPDNDVEGRIYRNGVAVGTLRLETSTTYVEYSEDISGWSQGDLCQIYARAANGSSKNPFVLGFVAMADDNWKGVREFEYGETGPMSFNASSAGSGVDSDLSASITKYAKTADINVEADAVTINMGCRENGSSLNRYRQSQTNADVFNLPTNLDSNGVIELYVATNVANTDFVLNGYWI